MLNVIVALIDTGGAAACLIAGRLAAADRSLKILVVEAGPQTKTAPLHVQPALFNQHFDPQNNTMKYVVAPPSAQLDGRVIAIPAAQCLGGGSSVHCE